MYDPNGLQVLGREECLGLMASVPIGRIVFTERALPAIRPVNFVVDGEDIVIRSGPGSKLLAAVDRTVVAFEADQIDADTHTGWSVTAIGRAEQVTAPEELERLARLPLRPWAPGARTAIIRIRAELVSGRRLVDEPAAVQAAVHPAGQWKAQ